MPPKPKDWTGTIISVLGGLAAIAFSFIPTTGVFMGAFMQSLLAKGINDVWQSTVAAQQGSDPQQLVYQEPAAMVVYMAPPLI